MELDGSVAAAVLNDKHASLPLACLNHSTACVPYSMSPWRGELCRVMPNSSRGGSLMCCCGQHALSIVSHIWFKNYTQQLWLLLQLSIMASVTTSGMSSDPGPPSQQINVAGTTV